MGNFLNGCYVLLGLTAWLIRIPVLFALALDLLSPQSPLLNLFIFVLGMYVWIKKAVLFLCAGYVENLYLTEEYRQSWSRVAQGFVVPIARRALISVWFYTRSVFYVITWNRAAVSGILSLCCVVSWYFLYISWQQRIESFLLKSILGEIRLTSINSVYGALEVICTVLGNTRKATRAVAYLRLRPAPPFSYSSAPDFDPSTRIRLLRLDRRLPFSEISAQLIAYGLEEAPPYHAISYTWSHGPPTHKHIKLNGMSLRVQSNVYDILLQCSSFFEPQLIWIDSICIDQTSPSEKTVQVRRMQEIYERAAHVLVCLGTGSGYLALSLLREVKWAKECLGDTYVNRHVITEIVTAQQTNIHIRAKAKALAELLQHTWFNRIWVVQEVVVAQDVTICYGQQSVPLLEFHELCSILTNNVTRFTLGQIVPQSGTRRPPAWLYTSLPFMVACRNEYIQQGPGRITDLLRVCGDREATVLIDKVFSLIGMARSYSGKLTQLVNYVGKTDEDTLLDLAHILFDHDEAFEVFDLAGIGWTCDENPDLPSWVVDWTISRSGMPLLTKFCSLTTRYDATKGTLPYMKRGGSRREMMVRGKSLGCIRSILPIPGSNTTPPPPIEVLLTMMAPYLDESVKLARKDVQDPYAGQPLEEAVWRTLIGDKTDAIRPAPAHYGRALRSSVQVFQEPALLAQIWAPDNVNKPWDEEALSETWTLAKVEEIEQDMRELANIGLLYDSTQSSQTHVFCTTESGYIGMVPQWSRVGDVVCLIYGLDVPYILRKVGGRFRLVGNSYVHGFMDGQGLHLPHEDGDFILF